MKCIYCWLHTVLNTPCPDQQNKVVVQSPLLPGSVYSLTARQVWALPSNAVFWGI